MPAVTLAAAALETADCVSAADVADGWMAAEAIAAAAVLASRTTAASAAVRVIQ
ncbi:hypothetical protein SDC9_133639 [bioreactor metagenome]|uniref:Uncharacterized protein n=1 Tax=bioreactor metagenome TaxID=1076179 RepID=A0A645DAS5_9ZZZZ